MDNRISLPTALLLLIAVSAAASPAFHAFTTNDIKNLDSEANKFFHAIPKEERTEFLVVSLVLGLKEHWPTAESWMRYPPPRIPQDLSITEDAFEKFKNMDTPSSFRKNLVTWVMSRFQLSPHEVLNLCLKRVLCLPDGTCFNTGDTGDLCCPF